MPRAHHLAVVLPVEGRGAEVNQADLRVLYLPHVLPLQHQVSGLLAFLLLFLKLKSLLFINSITLLPTLLCIQNTKC